jgi:hypothetical protein
VWKYISTRSIVKDIQGKVSTIMATLDAFIADVTKFQTDVAAAIARAQASIDDLKKQLANAGLTPAQQAALDATDKAVQAADATVGGFDIPTPPPTA